MPIQKLKIAKAKVIIGSDNDLTLYLEFQGNCTVISDRLPIYSVAGLLKRNNLISVDQLVGMYVSADIENSFMASWVVAS